jgi:diguanylate cyclase (GGDEF)-like protein
MDETRAAQRRDALDRYAVLHGAAAVGLDRAARLARFISRSRFAAVNILDDRLQYPVAAVGGFPLGAEPVQDSMCIRVVEAGTQIYTPDATADARFQDNPFTTGPEPIRFYSASPLRVDTGAVVGTLCVFDTEPLELDDEQLALLEDVAAQVAQHLELHRSGRDLAHAATHDPLTELPNRTLLSDRLAHAMTRRRRRAGEPALALIDLDGFKRVNDRLGHQAGDEVLVQTAERLRSCARAEDTVARFGGDEFVVLYEQLPDESVDQLVDVLHARLEQAFVWPFSVYDELVHIKASVGVVAAAPEELGYELLGRADALMYRRKMQQQARTPDT